MICTPRPPSQPALLPVDQDEGESDDDRRYRERKVNQDIQQPSAGEAVSRKQQRHADSEHDVQEYRNARDKAG